MVIRYDTALGKFVTYMPTFPMDSPADVVVKGSDGYIVVMKKATSVTFTGTAWDGKISLSAGINTTSVPLKSETEWRLSDLATYIGKNVNMIIWYDTALGKFVTWMPTFPVTSPANKIVNGGEGYIVVMKTAVDVTFKGKAWENVAPAAPPLMLNLADNNFTTTPLLVIEGVVAGENIGSVLNGINVTVNNLSTKANMADVTGVITEDGRFVATFVDLGSNCAARVGDVLEITVFNSTGEFSSEMIEHIVTENDIQNRRIWLGSVLISPIPQKNALLQNYPNPFNPETWIPYQLKESATVVIRIYNVSGQLVRLLDIGHRQAGFYVDKMKAAYWDGRNESGERVASGVYFYQLEAGNFFAVRKLTIIK
ncbi:T9SS type A sorting domain-containing protein [Candidatus Poribacteria bacterium]|nr:T9SS type A sorting domain-containing protein [Candidatus Poribacteria bacterium]